VKSTRVKAKPREQDGVARLQAGRAVGVPACRRGRASRSEACRERGATWGARAASIPRPARPMAAHKVRSAALLIKQGPRAGPGVQRAA
jgi:hypothetical protein